MRILMTLSAALLGLSLVPGAAVAGGKKPFSATAVQSVKGQPSQTGQIFVSDSGTRFEYLERGREVVKVILHKQNTMRILFPKEKTYMEIKAPADTPLPESDDDTPCPTLEGLSCQKIADVKFGTLDVEQWRQDHAPSQTTSMLWWEPVRKMIVRQEFPDGRIMQLALGGNVTFDNRQTERWDISLAMPGGEIATAYRLIDQDLNIIVKEESPTSGMSRELRDVKVMGSDQGWFDVPGDYKRIEAPQMPTQQ